MENYTLGQYRRERPNGPGRRIATYSIEAETLAAARSKANVIWLEEFSPETDFGTLFDLNDNPIGEV